MILSYKAVFDEFIVVVVPKTFRSPPIVTLFATVKLLVLNVCAVIFELVILLFVKLVIVEVVIVANGVMMLDVEMFEDVILVKILDVEVTEVEFKLVIIAFEKSAFEADR
jgi:hypothetical protein